MAKKDRIPFRTAFLLFCDSVKRVWRFNKRFVLFTCFVLFFDTLLESAMIFAVALFNKRIIDRTVQYASYFYVFYPLLAVLLLTVIHGAVFSIWRWVENRSMDMLSAQLLRESADKAAKIDFSSFDDPEFLNRIQKGWAQGGKTFINSTSTLCSCISNIIGTAAYISILAMVDWKLILAITVIRICVNPLIGKHYTWTYRLNNRLAELRRKEQYYKTLFESKPATAEGRLFALHEYAVEHFEKAHAQIYRATLLHKIKINALLLLSNIIYYLPVVIGYIYLSIGVFRGTVSLADMTLFISMYMGFVNQMYNTISNVAGVRNFSEQSRYAKEFLAYPTTICTEEDRKKDRLRADVPHSVEFCHVSFRYAGTQNNVLENVSFRIDSHETVSIIGANGAGKTTLILLLMRIYDPTEGVILLDGKDIREYSAESLYGLFGVLFQDYCDYAFSVRESVALSTENISEKRLKDALRRSTACTFTDQLKYGTDTLLSRRFHREGTELSAGQKQRIALARAYYKNAPILILDEPSASIDPASEAEILYEVEKMRGTKSIWLISHRLSTCVASDRVLLLQNGKLIGDGNHHDLLGSCEEYRRMFRLQADRYEA